MAQTAFTGPIGTFGNLDQLPAATFGAPPGPVPDPNSDLGPSFFYQGTYMPDARYIYPGEQVQGRRGVVAGQMMLPALMSVEAVPAAVSTSNIAAAANAVSGTAMTLATAGVNGVTPMVPVVPFGGALNAQAPITSAIALDFGFAFGNCTAGSASVTVAASLVQFFTLGMPLVIGNVGNSAGTIPLLTQVSAINTTTNVVTLVASAVPMATNSAAPIGTGNIWSEGGNSPSGGPNLPTAAFPFIAAGPGMLLAPRQAVARAISITGATGGSGGTFAVKGADVYGMAMTQTVTVGAGAVTGYSAKAFKYIYSVTPNFSDAHNYSVGTSDVFGFNTAAQSIEDTNVWWAGAQNIAATGFTAAIASTAVSSATTGDVRGTVQTSASGGGSGIGSTASNGAITSLVQTGNRLVMSVTPTLFQMTRTSQSNPAPMFGPTQF